MRSTSRIAPTALVLVIAATLAACGRASNAATDPTTSPSTQGASRPTTPAAEQPLPSQLWGTWRTIGQNSDPSAAQRMVLSAKGYAFYTSGPEDAAIGHVWLISATQIRFGTNQLSCRSDGTYTWQIRDNKLYFTGGEDDSCRRSGILPNYPWEKIPDSQNPADTVS